VKQAGGSQTLVRKPGHTRFPERREVFLGIVEVATEWMCSAELEISCRELDLVGKSKRISFRGDSKKGENAPEVEDEEIVE
jgi:hypothetical protein